MRFAEDFIGFGRFQRCLLIIAGLGFMADAIEVGAAHGKGGKGEEPGLIISLVGRKFPLAFIRAFCRLKVSEILYYIILYYIILHK